MPTPEEYATMTIGRMRLGPALDSPGYRDLHECIAAALRAAVAEATGPLHKCHVCGRKDDARHLLDVKGNFPGGCKVTCLECVGRLAAKEEAAKVADGHASNYLACVGIGRPQQDERAKLYAEACGIVAREIRSLP